MGNARVLLSHSHSKKVTDLVVNDVLHNKIAFGEIIDLMMGNDKMLAQRAAWVMSYVVQRQPASMFPHIEKLMKKAKAENVHVAIKRNVMRACIYLPKPSKYDGLIIDTCFYFLNDLQNSIAVRAFAVQTLTKYLKYYFDIHEELEILLEYNSVNASAAMKNVIAKCRNEIKIQERYH